ncbi:BTAD domain-containing putative transcriptional regulator [Actinomycetospora termitidis]|uniref:BTAD domain-containing putative transcriptional regulator n=1 Tax=Actinomycetospora termitidis TaxID=3053470 RepID=A0ABT7ME62_9PSEU|nr:BTAD domain-containing putative transcriptional regulator [Actinomycetospora sp. Odt1-22]MDL5158958.1 BTAD domain-containing putative transcriptional regulator [Actinomycetospora sp. Odt1-22]
MGSPQFRLLGDVGVERDGRLDGRSSVTARTLLTLLALNAGQAVDGDVLIDEAWGEDLPRNPRGALQIALSRLRTWIADTGATVTASAGLYTLNTDPDDVDLLRFLHRTDEALRGTDLDACRNALHLWRGTPMPGLAARRVEDARVHAQERRRALVAALAERLLAAGRAREVVDLLTPEDRLDEELDVLLVRAMRDAGRRRDAAAVCRTVIRRLRDELDAEPGPALRALHDELSVRPPKPVAPPEIIGRDDVLDQLDEPGLHVVLGPAGCGKSAVVRALGDRGGRLVGSAWGESGAPAAPWLEVAADLGLHGAPDRTLGAWLHAGLNRLARDAPVVITLDDAHRADSASTDVLRVLVRRGFPDGVSVVLAARDPDAVDHPVWRSALDELVAGGVTPTVLGPLDHAAVETLVRRRLVARAVDDEVVDALVRRSGGHALHLTALLAVLARAGTVAEAHEAMRTVPDQVRAVLAHQVDRLPTATRRSLEALAVLQPVDLGGLAKVLDARALAVADDLDPAVRAGLLGALDDRFAFRHELDVDGLRAAVPAVRAAHLHAARLETLAPDADEFEVLRHAEGAARVLPAARVGEARVRAGVAAYRRRALPEALALLDDVPDLPDDVRPLQLVHRALSLAGLHDDASDEAADALDRGLEAALIAGDAALATLAAIGDEPLGFEIGGDARRLARLRRVEPATLPPRRRLDLIAALGREADAIGSDEVPALVAQARRIADELPDDDVAMAARVRALEARTLVDAPVPGQERLAVATDAHRLALLTEDPALHLDGVELAMSAELAVGNTERAHKLRLDLELLAERWFRPRSQWAASAALAAMLLAEGDPEADAASGRAAARGHELGLPTARLAAGAHLLVAHLLRGTVADLEGAAVYASSQVSNTAAWAAAAALAAACAGHEETARAQLADFRRRVDQPASWFTRAAWALAAGAAHHLGDRTIAADVLEALPVDPDVCVLVGFGAAVLGPVTLWTGLAHATLDDPASARRDVAHAEAFAERAGWRPWLALARSALDDEAGSWPFSAPF